MNDCLAFRNYFKLAHKETLRNRRLDALVAAIAENPLPDHFLSEVSRQNNPPKNPFATVKTQ